MFIYSFCLTVRKRIIITKCRKQQQPLQQLLLHQQQQKQHEHHNQPKIILAIHFSIDITQANLQPKTRINIIPNLQPNLITIVSMISRQQQPPQRQPLSRQLNAQSVRIISA